MRMCGYGLPGYGAHRRRGRWRRGRGCRVRDVCWQKRDDRRLYRLGCSHDYVNLDRVSDRVAPHPASAMSLSHSQVEAGRPPLLAPALLTVLQALHGSLPPFSPSVPTGLLPYLAFVLLAATFGLAFYFSTSVPAHCSAVRHHPLTCLLCSSS
jgi:hypothetical protein